jgi:hypothetical protein
MQLNGSGDRGIGNGLAVAALGLEASIESYGATYDALWGALGDYGFAFQRRCTLQECGGRQSLTVYEATPYSLRVHYQGAEAGEARWSVKLTQEDATGWGGYEVCGVASETGHTADFLNDRLWAFRKLVSQGSASVVRGD